MKAVFVAAVLLLITGPANAQTYPVSVTIAHPEGGFNDAELKSVHADVVKALGEKKYATLFRIEEGAIMQIRMLSNGSTKEQRTTDEVVYDRGRWTT